MKELPSSFKNFSAPTLLFKTLLEDLNDLIERIAITLFVIFYMLITSGVTRGLSQGEASLERGPLIVTQV